MNATPPRWAERLLARALRDDRAGPAILGDLHEDFVHTARTRGPRAARRRYVREALPLASGRVFGRMIRYGTFPSTTSTTDERSMRDPQGPFRGFTQDARHALRAVRRNPGFSLFAALVIGLGVGATTAVFSVLKPLALAPLPLENPAELVWIANYYEGRDNSLSAITSRSGNLRDFRAHSQAFTGVTGYNAFFQGGYTLTGEGEPELLSGVDVAHDFLDVLGIEPLHGRGFTLEEGLWGGPPAVILTFHFWRDRFEGDPGIVGRSITIDQVARPVVGVLPPTFDFASLFVPGADVDFLLPFPVSDETDRWGNTMMIMGRLKPGVSAENAQADLDAVVAGLQEAEPDRWGLAARVTPLQEHIAGPFRPALLLLVAAAATVLLIACVNVSNLFLARSPGRAREVAVRKALGAARGRLVRQLVLEAMGVAVVGAAFGGALAWLVIQLVTRAKGVAIPLLDAVRVDGSALLFAAAAAVVTGLLVGLVPALQVAEGGEATVLRAGGRGASASRGARRLREWLVVAEVTLACVLLVVGGLFVQSFRAVLDVDLGFQPENVVAWDLNASENFDSFRARSDFYTQLASRVAEIPGVDEAGLNDALPLGRNRSWGFSVVGVPEEEDADDGIHPHIVDPGYLPALGIPLVQGRNFTHADTRDAPPVVMMNESGARRAFGGEEPLGRRIQLWDEREWEVVGIVHDVRHLGPEVGPGIQVYFPLTQMADFSTMELAVRSRLPTEQVTSAVGEVLREVDAAMPTREFWTVEARVDRAVSARRFTLSILSAYGLVALFLAGLGIYGVLAQSVAERKPEIGIRMALGASSPEVVRQVMGRTLALAGVGIALGAVVSSAGAGLLASQLFGVSANDPATFAGTALVLLAVAALAGAVPAMRAAGTRGVRALRSE